MPFFYSDCSFVWNRRLTGSGETTKPLLARSRNCVENSTGGLALRLLQNKRAKPAEQKGDHANRTPGTEAPPRHDRPSRYDRPDFGWRDRGSRPRAARKNEAQKNAETGQGFGAPNQTCGRSRTPVRRWTRLPEPNINNPDAPTAGRANIQPSVPASLLQEASAGGRNRFHCRTGAILRSTGLAQ